MFHWFGGSRIDNHLDTSKVVPPPFNIKLGLMKQYVKALNNEGGCLKYIKEKLTDVNAEKVNEDVFVGSQIRELTNP